MTQQDKDLLLHDLSARLPYGVKCQTKNGIGTLISIECSFGENLVYVDFDRSEAEEYDLNDGDTVKPYLRPMSSMTEEEKENLKQEHIKDEKLYAECLVKSAEGDNSMRGKVIIHFASDWCDKNMFDYRGLIPMGLALEAPDNMYKTEVENEAPVPKTVDEALSTLVKIISKEDKQYLIENGAISMHHTLGRWIRNEWGLWTNSELKNELTKKGFTHPDDMSNYIIEEFIKYLNKLM